MAKNFEVIMITTKNIFNYSIHLINGLLPIILIVYLNGKSSLTFMGYFFKALAIIGTVQLFVDYGFNFSGIRSYRELSVAVKPMQARINLFSNLIIVKVLIGLIIILGYILYSIIFLPHFIVSDLSYVIFGVLFSVTSFNWFFYAIDKSLEFNLILLVLRCLSFLLLFAIPIRLDNLLVINFAPFFISNLILMAYLLYKKFPRTDISMPSLEIIETFKSGWGIFSNGVIISFLTMSWPIFISKLISIEMVGVYGLADRISRGLRNLLGPLPFFILSRHSLANTDDKFTSINSKYAKIFGFLLISVPLFFMLVPSSMLGLVLKGDIINYRLLLNLYSLGFIAGALNSLFYTFLIKTSKESLYLIYFVMAYLLGIALGLLLETYIFMPLFVECILCLFLMVKFYVAYRKTNFSKVGNL